MNYESRLKKIEKLICKLQTGKVGYHLLILKPDESKIECLARHGLDSDLDNRVLFASFVSPGKLAKDQFASEPDPGENM